MSLAGDGEIEISGVAGMEHAGPADLTFLANPKYAPKVRTRAPPPSWRREPVTSAPSRPSSPPIPISISRARWRCSISRRGLAPGIHPLAYRRGHGRDRRERSIGPFAVSASA